MRPKQKSNNIMLSFLQMLMGTQPSIGISNMHFEHKVMEHNGITSHKKKPGRGHPAKGYDQVNHRWID